MKTHMLSLFLLTLSSIILCNIFAKETVTDLNSGPVLVRPIEEWPKGKNIHITFKSEIDNSLQPMLIKTPDDYIKDQSWPLLVVLHGLGDGPIVVPSITTMVQIGPFGRGDEWYREIGEQDVLECVDLAQQIFNIDADKIYLCGFSMGGAGTFELGLKHPDLWAACVPVCGRVENLNLVENGVNLPFWICTGGKDHILPPKASKSAYDKAVELGFTHWRYTEYEKMGHSFHVDWISIEKWLQARNKIHRPNRICFTSEQCAKAYWSEITEISNVTHPAQIHLEAASQTIIVHILNITTYRLYLNDAPVSLSKELSIIENSREIFKGLPPADGIFNRHLDN